MATAQQRRQYTRYHVRIKADCASPDLFVSNYVTNISRGGVFLRTDDTFAVGAEVGLTLNLPASEAICAMGRVAWNIAPESERSRTTSGAGIRFIGMSNRDRLTLDSAIRRLDAGVSLAATTSAPTPTSSSALPA